MSVLCLNVCRLCVPNIMSLGICLKNCTPLNLAHLLDAASTQYSRYFRCPIWKTKSWKKQTYMKTETCKLYSRVFWIFLQNVIKIDIYSFELYRFKVGAFFEKQCTYVSCTYICIYEVNSRSQVTWTAAYIIHSHLHVPHTHICMTYIHKYHAYAYVWHKYIWMTYIHMYKRTSRSQTTV